MKLILITDQHWGARNDNAVVLNNNVKFVENIFLPCIQEHNIKNVIDLGDLVDRRKYINFNTIKILREKFVEPLLRMGVIYRLILGNHDIHLRNRTEINVGAELFKHFDSPPAHKGFTGKFHFYEKPIEITFDGTPILFVPWICDSNREQTKKAIENSTAKILFGHLELAGFEMYKGIPAHGGEDPKIYSNFDIVCTGHYHHRSSNDNIHILGAAGPYIWSDYNDSRGFHIFDTKTNELEFIENPYRLFEKVFYDDSNDKVKNMNFSDLKDKYVKIVVTNCNNQELYEWFLNRIEEAQPIEYQIVNDHLNLDQIQDENIVSETKTTLEIIRDYVAAVNTSVDSVKLDNLLISLYQEASTLG